MFTSSKHNTLFDGYTGVWHDVKFNNPSDWYYNWTEKAFMEKDIVPYSVSNTRLIQGEEVTLTAPEGTKMMIYGPGLYQSAVTSTLEFSSQRKGTYTVKMFLQHHKVTSFSIEVV